MRVYEIRFEKRMDKEAIRRRIKGNLVLKLRDQG